MRRLRAHGVDSANGEIHFAWKNLTLLIILSTLNIMPLLKSRKFLKKAAKPIVLLREK
jgi:hypothetical protein